MLRAYRELLHMHRTFFFLRFENSYIYIPRYISLLPWIGKTFGVVYARCKIQSFRCRSLFIFAKDRSPESWKFMPTYDDDAVHLPWGASLTLLATHGKRFVIISNEIIREREREREAFRYDVSAQHKIFTSRGRTLCFMPRILSYLDVEELVPIWTVRCTRHLQ